MTTAKWGHLCVIEQGETECYGYVPQLPGVGAHGSSVARVRELLQLAVTDYLAAGHPVRPIYMEVMHGE